MIPLSLLISWSHLIVRKRQTLASVLGVAMGVGFFISVSGMMKGFHDFFRTQIIESNAHIVISDEVRHPPRQPAELTYQNAAIQVKRAFPQEPVRGILGASTIIDSLHQQGIAAAPVLRGQVLLRRSGRDAAVSMLGIDPDIEGTVTTLPEDLIAGSLNALNSVPDGIIIGNLLAEKLGASLGDSLIAATPAGIITNLKIVGVFRTGLNQLDEGQTYVHLVKQQSLQNRPRVINEIRIRLPDVAQSIPVASSLETRWGYKAAPWEETNSRVLAVFQIQNLIIYSTVSAILIVAGFGIFNIISTVVLEKSRDIAILRSIGLNSSNISNIFVIEGTVVGFLGSLMGWIIGYGLSWGIEQIPAPGASDPTQTLIVDGSLDRYLLAGALAVITSILAGWLPARKAARLNPLLIVRGAT
ncbi:MAG: ABC transporter permease [Alphaproteobacteria bacterium]|jgi:lipoprotein-releasing system permease protein|nr:ABC transporter permease [Alphaproteobacteria bacterium]